MLLKVVNYHGLKVLPMSVLCFKKKMDRGVGGWSELYPLLFCIWGIVLTFRPTCSYTLFPLQPSTSFHWVRWLVLMTSSRPPFSTTTPRVNVWTGCSCSTNKSTTQLSRRSMEHSSNGTLLYTQMDVSLCDDITILTKNSSSSLYILCNMPVYFRMTHLS